MSMHHFTPWSALLGGALIGLSATLLLLLNGRTAGVSGIFEGLFSPASREFPWRLWFVLGLLAGGALFALTLPETITFGLERSAWAIIASGLLVGFGARLGSGCTSGHGVCGMASLRRRSMVSVLTFVGTAAVVVYLVNRVAGGVL